MGIARVAVALVLGVGWSLAAAPSDLATVLADMRRALGGEAALRAVESFELTGNQTRMADAGPARTGRTEIAVQLPDKYLRSQYDRRGVSFQGFNVDFPIRGARGAAGRPNAVFVSGQTSPEEADRRLTQVARGYQREFARLALALFGRSFSAYPMELRYVGRESRADREFDVVEAVDAGGDVVGLAIDARSHLPAEIVWMAIPATVVTSGSARLTLTRPEPVQHRMVLSAYRTEHGLNWPRVLSEYAGSQLVQETRVERVRINPDFPDGFFSATR
jgi:hypothetical protein